MKQWTVWSCENRSSYCCLSQFPDSYTGGRRKSAMALRWEAGEFTKNDWKETTQTSVLFSLCSTVWVRCNIVCFMLWHTLFSLLLWCFWQKNKKTHLRDSNNGCSRKPYLAEKCTVDRTWLWYDHVHYSHAFSPQVSDQRRPLHLFVNLSGTIY